MCEKLSYCGTRIDSCLLQIISEINSDKKYRTLLSCCGHGKVSKDNCGAK